MSTKRVYILLMILFMNTLSISLCQGFVYATDTIELKQVYGSNQYLDMFITEKLDSDTLTVKVSNKDATINGSGVCVDEGITSKTTVLIDVSKSMPNSVRSNVYTLLDSIINGISASEELRIVTFDESLTILRDFTSDRYDLSKATKKIQFDGEQSKIYDAIFNTIPEVGPIEGSPSFYRTIVITDGVDDTASGVTKEELFIKLQNKTYPIDVIEVSNKKVDPNKNLAALNRISNGNYNQLNTETDVNVLTGNIKTNHMFWIRVVVPDDLADGSVRQINVEDGIHSIQFDTKVMVYDTEEINLENEIGPTEVQTDANKATQEMTIENSDNDHDSVSILGIKFSKKLFTMTIVGIIVTLVSIMLIVILIVSKKKKDNGQQNGPRTIRQLDSNRGLVNSNRGGSDMTEFVGLDTPDSTSGNIEKIRLRNTDDSYQVWNLKLNEEIIIGRETHCKVCIPESSMSRKQCKLTKVGTGVEVTNISTSNMTLLNGELLSEPRKLKTGDKLKCGRAILIVELLHSTDSLIDEDLNRGTEFINI